MSLFKVFMSVWLYREIMLLYPHIFFLTFWSFPMACGILVPQPEIEPIPPALEVQSLNHWTTREVPGPHFWSCQMTELYNYSCCLSDRGGAPHHGLISEESITDILHTEMSYKSISSVISRIYVCIIFISIE